MIISFEENPKILLNPSLKDIVEKLELGYRLYYISHDTSNTIISVDDVTDLCFRDVIYILLCMKKKGGFFIYYRLMTEKEEKE